MQPHKHRKYINLWADGYPIQMHDYDDEWVDDPNPTWEDTNIYRVKPQTKEFTTYLSMCGQKLIVTNDVPEYYKPNFTIVYDEHTCEVISITKIKE